MKLIIHGDNGYNEISFLDVPFKGSQIIAEQEAENIDTASVRVTVDWKITRD